MKYCCTDGYGDEIAIEANTATDAAQEYVDTADWGDGSETVWVDVICTDETGNEERVTITIEPDEPACANESVHDWQTPYCLLGGIKENPGCWGHGGGVITHEVCLRCGLVRRTDTWHTRCNGTQATRVDYLRDQYTEEELERAR